MVICSCDRGERARGKGVRDRTTTQARHYYSSLGNTVHSQEKMERGIVYKSQHSPRIIIFTSSA